MCPNVPDWWHKSDLVRSLAIGCKGNCANLAIGARHVRILRLAEPPQSLSRALSCVTYSGWSHVVLYRNFRHTHFVPAGRVTWCCTDATHDARRVTTSQLRDRHGGSVSSSIAVTRHNALCRHFPRTRVEFPERVRCRHA